LRVEREAEKSQSRKVEKGEREEEKSKNGKVYIYI